MAVHVAATGTVPSPASDPHALALAAGGSLLLMGWALVYSWLLGRLTGLSRRSSLRAAALCHSPLLLLVMPAALLAHGGPAPGIQDQNQYGRVLWLPLAVDYLVMAPLGCQVAVAAALRVRSWGKRWPIITMVLLSLALRLSHAAWGLPALLHPDEHRYYGPATIMAARGDLNPHYFQNPSLMIYLTYLTLELLGPQSRAFMAADQLFDLGIPNPRGDFLDMVALRTMVAAMGAATVALTYLAGRQLFSRRGALLGAAILAVSFLHVRNSHYATNDILATTLLAASFLFSARLHRSGKPADYLLAAIFGGLATSAKYNAGFFALAILVAHLLRLRSVRKAEGSSGRGAARTGNLRSHLPLLGSAAASLASFLAGTPYALLDFPAFTADFREQLAYGSEPWFGQQAQPSWLIFLTTLAWGFGVLPLALATAAAIWMVRRDASRLLLIVSTPAAYYLFMSSQHLFFARFALPALPFLAIMAGQGADLAASRWKLVRRPPVAMMLLAVILAQPLVLTLQHDRLLAQPDTRFLAAQWIDSHLPVNASLAMESYSLLDPKFGWKGHHVQEVFVFWPENEQSRGMALSGAFRYVVVSSFGYGPWQPDRASPSSLPIQYSPLEEKGRLVAVFAPGPGNSEIPYAIDDMYTPFWHLFDRERPGPTVRIYEMGTR